MNLRAGDRVKVIKPYSVVTPNAVKSFYKAKGVVKLLTEERAIVEFKNGDNVNFPLKVLKRAWF